MSIFLHAAAAMSSDAMMQLVSFSLASFQHCILIFSFAGKVKRLRATNPQAVLALAVAGMRLREKEGKKRKVIRKPKSLSKESEIFVLTTY